MVPTRLHVGRMIKYLQTLVLEPLVGGHGGRREEAQLAAVAAAGGALGALGEPAAHVVGDTAAKIVI